MQALLTTGADGPGLALGEAPEPTPASNQLVVGLTATSLNRGEVAHLHDEKPGTVLGWDVVGTVIEPAVDGSGPDTGARVVGIVDDGGWAERVAVAHMPLPSSRMPSRTPQRPSFPSLASRHGVRSSSAACCWVRACSSPEVPVESVALPCSWPHAPVLTSPR